MFLTYQPARILDFGLFQDGDAWRYVEHSIHRPWFYVAAIEDHDEFTLQPMYMLSDERCLQSLLAQQIEGRRILNVQLVTPDHMNESGQWMMEPLDEIMRCETPDGVAYVYTVRGGKRYTYGEEKIIKDGRVLKKKIFGSEMLSPSSNGRPSSKN